MSAFQSLFARYASENRYRHSQKLAIRFGETIKAYIESETLNISDLKLIPLVFAGWLRYLMAADDSGKTFTLSDDPLLDTVYPYIKDFTLGDKITAAEAKERLSGILTNAAIFGVDLIETGIADLVCEYFIQLISGIGSVERH
jgi:fructuronate reductase